MSWPKVRLVEVAKIVSGATPSTSNDAYWNGDVSWVTPKDLSDLKGRKFLSGTPRTLTELGLKACSAEVLPPHSVLFSSRAPIGLVAINKLPVATNQGFKSFIPDRKRLDADYLYHWLRLNRPALEQLGVGATFKEVSKAIVSRVEIPLPPLEEQQRIAAMLDKAEELRAKRRAAIGLLDQLPQAIFLEMFGDPKTNPKGWPVGSLTDPSVAVIFGGGTPSRAIPAYFEGDICWATSKDIKRELLVDTQEHVTAEAVARSATKLVPSGSLLVVVKSKILARTLPLAISQVPVCFGQDLKGIVPKKPESVHFLFHSLKAGERWLLERARGINTEGLTLEHLRDFPLSIPPADLQGRFGAKVEAIHRARAANQSALGKLDRLIASLQATAFKGEF